MYELQVWPLHESREDYYTILVEAPEDNGRFPPTASGLHCIQVPRRELSRALDQLERMELAVGVILIPDTEREEMGCFVQEKDGYRFMTGWALTCSCLTTPEENFLWESTDGLLELARHYNDLLKDGTIPRPWWEFTEYRSRIP